MRAPESDPVVSRAARIAALVAVPVAVLAGIAAYRLTAGGPDAPSPAASGSAAPQRTGTVTVPTRSLPARQATVCRALLAKLPQRLRDRDRRPVSGDPEQNAAWGDPAVVLTCGVPQPEVPADAQVWLLNGVCWLNHDSTAWTTVDREVPVTVTVPKAYGPGGQWVIDFSDPLAAAVPERPDQPAGCR